MNLDGIKVLQIVLGEAMTTNDCDATASFANATAGVFNLREQNTKTDGTTPVTVVNAPPGGLACQVKEIRCFNNDTVSHVFILQLFDGTDTWIVDQSDAIVAGKSYVYTPNAGITVNGTGGGGGTSLTVQDDTGDTITSVGDLTFVGVKVSGSTPSGIVNMTTITGPDGVGATAALGVSLKGGKASPAAGNVYGGNVYFDGGGGGSGADNTYGGTVRANAGQGGDGTYSTGGGVLFSAGSGGSAASQGQGGPAVFQAGASFGVSNGGAAGFYGGTAYGTGHGGDVQVIPGNAVGGGRGGNFSVTTGTGTPPGRFTLNNNASLMFATYSWVAGALLDNQTIFTAVRAMVVTAVIGRPDAANGSAANLTIVKAPDTTPPASGTPLTSTSMDLDGTPDTNQTLTLSVTLADITLAAGDSLCMVTTGALTLSAGCITIWGTPQ
jgi:hypothetical protein